MSGQYPPPPTYVEPFTTDPRTGKQSIDPQWLQWFLGLVQVISNAGGGTTGNVNHENLAGLQGGNSTERYHLTSIEHGLVALLGSTTGTGAVVLASGPSITNPVVTGLISTDVILGHTNAGYTDGSGSATGTVTNAPRAGNPSKWVPINDNGVTRYIPAW